jgi:tRNA A37 threonylcarbamoyladenosine synthetase subunit TsaC/SUA5/YrdC
LPAVTWRFREGGIVAFPTDTFYGLAVDPSSARAVKRLFELKERDGRMAVPARRSVVTWWSVSAAA